MTFNFDSLKVPVFTNINDSPTAPTSIKGGNASHLISLYNNFVDSTQQALNSLLSSANNSGNQNSSSSTEWIVVNNDYEASSNQKVIFANYNPPSGVFEQHFTLPAPQPGLTASFISTNASIDIVVNFNGHPFGGAFYYRKVYLTGKDFTQIDFIYIDNSLGWISPQRKLLSTESDPT